MISGSNRGAAFWSQAPLKDLRCQISGRRSTRLRAVRPGPIEKQAKTYAAACNQSRRAANTKLRGPGPRSQRLPVDSTHHPAPGLCIIFPVLVGQLVSLFKDATLDSPVGLFDLVGIAKCVLANPDWLGKQLEVYALIAASLELSFFPTPRR